MGSSADSTFLSFLTLKVSILATIVLQVTYTNNNFTGYPLYPLVKRTAIFKFCSSLFLAANKLDGSIPSTMDTLNNLKRLYLSQNKLSGQLPHEICNGKNLMEFDAGHNNLPGPIPSSLFLLTNLTYVNLIQSTFWPNANDDWRSFQT